MRPPKSQDKTLRLIAQQLRQGERVYPAGLAAAMGLHPTSVWAYLLALESKGLVELKRQGKGHPTLVTLTTQGRLETGMTIPVLGQIAAGSLGEAQQELIGLLPLPGRSGLFGLRVKGDSMAEFLLEGDLAIVERKSPLPGQIAAVYYHGATTLKYFYPLGSKVLLKAHNPAYAPIELPSEEIEVHGVWVSSVRGELASRLEVPM